MCAGYRPPSGHMRLRSRLILVYANGLRAIQVCNHRSLR